MVLGEIYLWSLRVIVKFFHQVHAAFRVDCPVDSSMSQADLSQVNCDNAQHAGPLGHDHAAHHQRGHTT